MKILIYSPYLDILGGGEQYLLNFARCMAGRHQITFVWKNPSTLKQASTRFQISTANFSLIPFLPPRSRLREYDVLFFVSDGSIPFLPFRKSILLFMSPFVKVGGHLPPNRLKLKFINHIVCFSQYTKKFIDAEFHVNSKLIYPGVEIREHKTKKQNIILSVGRFTQTLHLKKQEALIDAFIDLEGQLPEWQLFLVGGTEKGSQALLKKLRQKARGHRITIKTNVSDTALTKLYAQAKIYWHASGFGADLRVSPQKAEHFGLSIVEAMGQASVPVVFNAGGPKEIVTTQSGKTWNHLKELKDHTVRLAQNESARKKMALNAKKRAKFFNRQKFCQKFYELIEK